MSTYYICKSCGRSLRVETKPTFCYCDRTTNIENISDEDSVKMGLFSTTKGVIFPLILKTDVLPKVSEMIIEFPGDLRYHPYTGEEFKWSNSDKYKLSDFQNEIMRKVVLSE